MANGLPSRSTIEIFDGAGKVNGIIPPSNSAVDWQNPSLALCTSDVAGLGLVSPRFWCTITLASTTGGLILNAWFANWSTVTSTTPILSRSGTGTFTVTLPATVNTEYAASVGQNANIPVNLLMGQGCFQSDPGGTANIAVSCSSNVITIYVRSAGSLSDMVGKIIGIVAH